MPSPMKIHSNDRRCGNGRARWNGVQAGSRGGEIQVASILITATASLIDYFLLRIGPVIGPERRGWQANAVGEIA